MKENKEPLKIAFLKFYFKWTLSQPIVLFIAIACLFEYTQASLNFWESVGYFLRILGISDVCIFFQAYL